MRLRLLLIAAATAAATLAPTAGATTNPSVYVDIHVTLTDTKTIVTPAHAPRGSDARFIVRNLSSKPQTFTIGNVVRGSGLQTGFSKTFSPGKGSKVLLLYLDYRGVINYYSGKSFAKTPKAKKGSFLIGAPCAQCIYEN